METPRLKKLRDLAEGLRQAQENCQELYREDLKLTGVISFSLFSMGISLQKEAAEADYLVCKEMRNINDALMKEVLS
jgi:hypothetical protein